MNFQILPPPPPPPPFDREIWDYEKANVTLIRRSIVDYPCQLYFSLNDDPNICLNIISNFTPNDPPWTTKPFYNYVVLNKTGSTTIIRDMDLGYKDKGPVDSFRKVYEQAVRSAKENYFKNLGRKLADPNTSQKTYWKFINRTMKKCKVPKISPLQF